VVSVRARFARCWPSYLSVKRGEAFDGSCGAGQNTHSASGGRSVDCKQRHSVGDLYAGLRLIYEATIMQLVTPLLIKEWGIAPATIGNITTVSRWVGLIGIFVFPTLADLYGRRPVLVLTILGYSLFTGLTGFAQGPLQLLIFTSITRITLQGETPVGMIMVSETAPTKWRATALGGLVGGYPFGYMLCSLTALVVVPLWGWRSLYWLGILPALLVLWVRLGVKESPRFERVTSAMLTEGLRKRLNIWAPMREYPREMLTATLLYFFYLFTWIGWSAWMPQFLANEKHLGFQTTASYLSIWMFCAIFAYYLCGWLPTSSVDVTSFPASSSRLRYFWSYWVTSTPRRACSGWGWS
jgi:MFS family permease